MNLVLYSNKIDEYLKHDDVIDYENEAIAELADTLFQRVDNEIDYIKAAYQFVRDQIPHSADIGEDGITCTASEVLKAGPDIKVLEKLRENEARSKLWDDLPTKLAGYKV